MKTKRIHLYERTNNQQFPFVAQHGIKYKSYPPHTHDCNELFIIVSGSAIHKIGKCTQRIEKGDVFHIKHKELEHCFENPEQLELYNFMFYDSFISELNYDLLQLEGYQTLFVLDPFFMDAANYQNKIQLKVYNTSVISQLAQRIFTEYTEKRPGYMTLIKALFTELIVTISREFEIQNSHIEPNRLMQLAKAIAYIENNFQQDISISMIAQMASLSERHFIRTFKACYNTTPINYINQLRIKHAKELLQKPDIKVKEVAFKCGFTDQNYFSRKFKELVGASPRLYKESAAYAE